MFLIFKFACPVDPLAKTLGTARSDLLEGHPCHAVCVVPRPSREPIKEVARMARLKRLLDELVRFPRDA